MNRIAARCTGIAAAVATGFLAAGCGSATSPTRAQSASTMVPASSLATSVTTPAGTWAVVVMGGSARQYENFWQLFIRPAGGSSWKLVTPPGTADNGGLVLASGGGSAMITAFRPSQRLTYTPLTQTTDGGRAWSALNPLDAALAASPDSLAVPPAGGATLALLTDGTAVVGRPDATRWTNLASSRALIATPAGRRCGLKSLTAAAYTSVGVPLLAGTCSRAGAVGIFAEQGGTWQATGPAVPAGLAGQDITVLRLATSGKVTSALLQAGSGHAASLFAAWAGPNAHWTDSPLFGLGDVGLASASFGPNGAAAIITTGDRGAVIDGKGGAWRELPALPAGTATLIPSAAGRIAAMAVKAGTLTVWQLDSAGSKWAKTQAITVPIQYGSSS
jgi:hypothetical protein